MEDSNMMTKAQFESELRDWGSAIRSLMRDNLNGHGTGALAKSIKVSVRESKKTTSHYVGFKFHRYGVFVAYGVGRGWIREDGTLKRGSRVKKGSAAEMLLKGRGYTKKDIRSYRLASGGSGKERKPLDWFDSVLTSNTESLGDIAAEYYGDYSMEQLAEMINRMTIKK